MKFGQLIKNNMRNIFLEQSYTKCGVEILSEPFLKNQDLAYSGINGLKFYAVCFYYMLSWGLSKFIQSKLQAIWIYPI